MMKKTLFAAFAAAVFSVVAAEKEPPLDIRADVIRGDNVSGSLSASGHVTAVRAPFKMMSESVSRDAEKVYRFANPTMFTTCTNEIGRLHWHVTGGFEFEDGEYGLLRDGWAHLWEIPCLWIPYLYVPIGSEEGFRIMPGYIGRWGAFLMTKYIYHIAGTRASEDPEGWGLDGNTRFDLRYKQGVAFGETLKWRAGEYGSGHFKVYYAWDQNVDGNYNYADGWHNLNWGSEIPTDRYAVELVHDWLVTERDRIWIKGAVFSDSYFRQDFFRNGMFMLKNQFLGYDSNAIGWEHLENWAGFGTIVSGPLNDFVAGTSRLPEFHFDLNPLPVFGLPVNYETQNRVGFLRRSAAHYGRNFGERTVYSYNPGPWADYETGRFDTYHRFTAPFKYDDVLSVVPRLAYRGTFWGMSGRDCLTGMEETGSVSKNVYRSILEGGVTFAARGTAELSDGWRHLVEPYLDVLAQKAWYAGLANGSRPYVFDSLDASLDWSEQFASRGRNLPYSWFGPTPGVRNAFDTVDEKGRSRRYFDLDTYVAVQCNDTSWIGDNDGHRLATAGNPNYGKRAVTPVPGFKFGWHPVSDTSLTGRFEYDTDNHTVALGGLSWSQRISRRFSYYARLTHSDYRHWDFSSCGYDPDRMRRDEMNSVRYTFGTAGFEHEICDAVAWSPYIRWDFRERQLDSAGGWIDFRTDCLGFRFLVEYTNSYLLLDGARYDEEFSCGFFVYLRAFGADAANLFQ